MSSETEGSSTSTANVQSDEKMEIVKKAAELMAQGKRNMVCGEIPKAVSLYEEALRMLARECGELSRDCAEAYYRCGSAYLELGRMETNVLGVALEGVDVEEKEDEEASEQFEKPPEDGDERDKLREEVYEAMAEGEREELAKQAREKREEGTRTPTEKDKESEVKQGDAESKTEELVEKSHEKKGEKNVIEKSKAENDAKNEKEKMNELVKTDANENETKDTKMDVDEKMETANESNKVDTDIPVKDTEPVSEKDRPEALKEDDVEMETEEKGKDVEKKDSEKNNEVEEKKVRETPKEGEDAEKSSSVPESSKSEQKDEQTSDENKESCEANKNESSSEGFEVRKESSSEGFEVRKESSSEGFEVRKESSSEGFEVTKEATDKEDKKDADEKERKNGDNGRSDSAEKETEAETITHESEETIKKSSDSNDDEKKEDSAKKNDDKKTDDGEEKMDENDEEMADENEGEEEEADDEGEETAEGEDSQEEDKAEDISNFQSAWEYLDIAKVIYLKNDSKDDQLKAAECYIKLGEVSMETEQHETASGDIESALKIQQKFLTKEDRSIAETHYQLGLAYGLDKKFDLSIQHYQSAISVIEAKIASLNKLVEENEVDAEDKENRETDALQNYKDEIKELQELIPEMRNKIEDTRVEAKDMEQMKEMAKEALGFGSTSKGFGSPTKSPTKKVDGAAAASGASEVDENGEKKPDNISHLVRKKRKPEEETPAPASQEIKKIKQDGDAPALVTGTEKAVNGTVDQEMADTETAVKEVKDLADGAGAAEATA